MAFDHGGVYPTAIQRSSVESITTAALVVETSGTGFFEITREAARFFDKIRARDGALLLFIRPPRHLLSFRRTPTPTCVPTLSLRFPELHRRMPAGYTTSRGRTTCRLISNPCSTASRCTFWLAAAKLAFGARQGIYVAEHRERPHRREVILQFLGSCEEV